MKNSIVYLNNICIFGEQLKQIEIMKTTKNTVLSKKIEKLVNNKELNRNSLVYGWVNGILTGKTEFRPVFTQGSSWKHSSLIDKTWELELILKKLNLTFSKSNDASRWKNRYENRYFN